MNARPCMPAPIHVRYGRHVVTVLVHSTGSTQAHVNWTLGRRSRTTATSDTAWSAPTHPPTTPTFGGNARGKPTHRYREHALSTRSSNS